MPRSSRSSRPAARAAPAPVSQSRSASTAAAPAAAAHHPVSQAPPVPHQAQAQAKQPGMLAQMAATAGSVAVGSTIGHGLSSMLFGGSSSSPAAPEAAAPPVQQQSYQAQDAVCGFQMKEFMQCMQGSNNDVGPCTFFLDQLRTCQAQAPSN